MAPPPASTVVNVNSGVSAPSYYPTYYPASATTTASSNDSWAGFATGAVVGGLLTWGIMEWADDDDWDDYHHVSHYYGDSVCHNGNCWSGGYYGDRGNVNYNKNINISGNDINIDRGANFNQNNLRPAQQPVGWQPNPRHRRGQAYPESVQNRLGGNQQSALAGQRLGSAQTLPASARGFAEAGRRPVDGKLSSERRPSSADIQQQLAKQTAAQSKLAQNKATKDSQGKLGQVGARDNALQGLKTSGQASRLESQRGANSRRSTTSGTLESRARQSTGGLAQTERTVGGSMSRQQEPGAQNQFKSPKPANRSEAMAGGAKVRNNNLQRSADLKPLDPMRLRLHATLAALKALVNGEPLVFNARPVLDIFGGRGAVAEVFVALRRWRPASMIETQLASANIGEPGQIMEPLFMGSDLGPQLFYSSS